MDPVKSLKCVFYNGSRKKNPFFGHTGILAKIHQVASQKKSKCSK